MKEGSVFLWARMDVPIVSGLPTAVSASLLATQRHRVGLTDGVALCREHAAQ